MGHRTQRKVLLKISFPFSMYIVLSSTRNGGQQLNLYLVIQVSGVFSYRALLSGCGG